jgi:hypothetical protein
MENNELKKMLFDIKKYRIRPANLSIASGISRSNANAAAGASSK